MSLTSLTQVPVSLAPSFQSFLSGSGTYFPTFAFIATASFTVTPTAGATYTNNAATFTVTQVVGTTVYATSSGSPALSGTLTKVTGTGDASISFSAFYRPVKLKIRALGGGGSGGGGGNAGTGGNGNAGGNTTFAIHSGATLITANGGGAGPATGNASGGSASVSTPAIQINIIPGSGTDFNATGNVATYAVGSRGGDSALGFGGRGVANGTGTAPGANTGGGGGPGGTNATASGGDKYSGAGGGGGGYAEAWLFNPSSSGYDYSIGAGGTPGGALGTNGFAGAVGGSGVLYIEENYSF